MTHLRCWLLALLAGLGIGITVEGYADLARVDEMIYRSPTIRQLGYEPKRYSFAGEVVLVIGGSILVVVSLTRVVAAADSAPH